MLDANGKYTQLTLNDALVLTLADAATAGIDVPSGSVEDQINNWLAESLVDSDAAMYALYVKMFNPTGSDIDLQNPGTPRLAATVSSGFLKIDNTLNPSPLDIAANSTFTAPNGNAYTNGSFTYAITGGQVGYVSVTSKLTGKAQNLPANQTFTSSYSVPITNTQPFVTGTDNETDAEYISRLVYLKTNNTSVAATPAAIKELLNYYSAARIYVNNTSLDTITPVPIPSNGYVAVVLFPSGTAASALEISNAITILSNRFEFGNALKTSTTLHPLLSGTIYTGTFPQVYTAAVAQAVKTTINVAVSVSFAAGTDISEKSILATAFASQFVQNLLNFYGGSAGTFHLTFQGVGSPTPSPVVSTPSVLAAAGIISKIGPVIAVEQVRAFISDEANAQNTPGLNYLSCTALTTVLDPQQGGEVTHTLNIAAPAGGSVSVIDFVHDALFSDSTSWYDRYIYLDPSLITVTVNEI